MEQDDKPPLRLVLLWHMHQPDFRDSSTGEFTQPWVYLHAIKDYTDMAEHFENHSAVHTVVNLVAILLDQLEDYAVQLMTRGESFSLHDRRRVFELIAKLISDIVPRYRRLAHSGRVELSPTSYC